MSRDLTLLSSATVSHFKVQEPIQTSKLQGEANLIKVNYRNEPGNSSARPLLTFEFVEDNSESDDSGLPFSYNIDALTGVSVLFASSGFSTNLYSIFFIFSRYLCVSFLCVCYSLVTILPSDISSRNLVKKKLSL
jgi:hypothetical protein